MTELDIQDLRKMSLGIGPISEHAIALAFGNSMQPLENDLPLSLKGFLKHCIQASTSQLRSPLPLHGATLELRFLRKLAQDPCKPLLSPVPPRGQLLRICCRAVLREWV